MATPHRAASQREPARVDPAEVGSRLQGGLAGKFRFENLDDFAAACPGWDHRIQQLGRGRPYVRLVVAQTNRVQIAVARREPGLRNEGFGPRHTVTLCLPLGGDVRVGGDRCGPGDVAYIPAGRPFELHAPGSHLVLVASVEQALFERVVSVCEVTPPQVLSACTWPVFQGSAPRRSFIAACGRWLSSALVDPASLADPERAEAIDESIASALLGSVECTQRRLCAPAPSSRLARRAEEILRSRLDRPITVSRLADALDTSVRTLHASFRWRYGMAPKAYLRSLRLDAARRELTNAEPGVSVTDVATRWCFFHLGRFSSDYQRAFGESPSQTLRQATRSPGS